MTVLAVAADDRTGALETAGACADAGLPATVLVRDGPPGVAACTVVDLGTRHRPAADAARAAAEAGADPATRHAHKIDSLLRGNWAHELVARHRATSSRVLVVPAFPAAGRTCEEGVVRVHRRPAATSTDARAVVTSSRPADHLLQAGAPGVTTVPRADLLDRWHRSGVPFAVCDARTDNDLAEIAGWWGRVGGVLLAGTAASIGAGAAIGRRPDPNRLPAVEGPVLVACGSLHAMARAQTAALLDAGAVLAAGAADAQRALVAGRHAVLETPPAAAPRVTHAEAEAAAASLAAVVRDVLGAGLARTLVLVGGDTAAAVLGDAPLPVLGTVAPGVAAARRRGGPLVLAKPGGFGDAGLLVRLLSTRMGP